MFEYTTVDQVWRDRVEASVNSDFLVFHDPMNPDRNRRVTYGQVAEEVDALLARLQAAGVGNEDRVILHLDNSVQFVVAMLAVAKAGAIAVPTITQYTRSELSFVAQHSGSAAIITSETYADVVLHAADSCPVEPAVLVDGDTRRAGARQNSEVREGRDMPGERIAMLMYTSGTTAAPKGVMISHRASLSAAYDNACEFRLRPEDRLYCVLPLFHVNAMFFQLMPAVLTGCSVVLGPVFSARTYWDIVASHGVTVGNLTNGPLRILLEQAPARTDREHGMRLMTYALPLDGDEILQFETRFGVPLSMGWGLTESLACGTRTPAYLEPRRAWQSIGMVSPGWDLRVVDESGTDVPRGEVGELLIRGPGLMSGYFRNPEATSQTLRGGWLWTGDLGYLDDRGYVFFHDRKKDVIKVKGENVSAGEVEHIVSHIDGIRDCAAVGVADPFFGEKIVMFVVADESVVDSSAVRQLCEERLASFKIPTAFVFVDELPRTSIGKIRKAELRSLALDEARGRERQ